MFNLAAGRIGSGLVDFRYFQRQRIGHRHVTGNVCEQHRIFRRDGIELLMIRKPFVWPKRVVPPAASNPFAFFVMRDSLRHALLHFLRRGHAPQFDRKRVRSRAAQVHVRVVKPGHHELLMQRNRFRAFLAPAAIEQHMSHFPNAGDLSVRNGHGFGPGARRIVRVNPAVHVKNGRLGPFLRIGVLPCRRSPHRHRKRETENSGAHANRSLPHRAFSSATPATPRTVNKARFNPTSRPVASYHSCNECAPPPVPPAPMEMASIPWESGMFASVEERSMRDWFPTNSSAARRAASRGESAESSPPGRLPSNSTFHSRFPLERSRGGSISSRTPAAIASRRADSSRVSSSSFSDRMSTLMRAS